MKARKLPIEPLIKSHPQAALIQRVFRHVHASSSIEITMEFSLVGIQGRRERVIGPNRSVRVRVGKAIQPFHHWLKRLMASMAAPLAH
jgi:hypothetical protein